MKHLLLSIFFVLTLLSMKAQQAPIMVCNPAGTTCAPYYNLDTAITYANQNDFIYVPGGNFSINVNITKRIHMIGAGHYPDSSAATGITVITGNIVLIDGSNNSSFDGLFIINDFRINTGTAISGIVISNCSFYVLQCDVGKLDNSVMKNCVSRHVISFNHGVNNLLTNSFGVHVYHFTNSTIANCIIAEQLSNLQNCTVKNCIVRSNNGTSSSGNSVYNNICAYHQSYGFTFPSYLSPGVSYNNTNIFTAVEVFANSNIFTFDYTKDYHITAISPAHNAGSDGTDIGVYGGQFPYKEGAIPSNPHIYFKQISSTTNANGDLPVVIKVRAEN